MNDKVKKEFVMNIDWITWSIWILGFIIWVVWIIIPIKEFIGIYRSHKQKD